MSAPLIEKQPEKSEPDALALLSKETDYLCEYWNKTEGRDKFGKFVQFSARFLSGLSRQLGNEFLGKQFEIFWRAMLDARRLHWLGKPIIELKTVEQTWKKGLPDDVKMAHCGARFFFALRWAVENVMILFKLGIFTGAKWQDLNKVAKRLWTVAIVLGLTTEVCKYRHAQALPEGAKRDTATKEACITFVQHCCDSQVPAVIGWDMALSDTRVGAFHAIAALLQSRNLYPTRK